MKMNLAILALLLAVPFSQDARAAEDWKGESNPSEFSAGIQGGLALRPGDAGFALLGSVAKKIVHQGFVPDINNSVWIEAQLGPVFIASTAYFAYSAHLRWDFVKDEDWTFFGLGGLAGDITGDKLGNLFELYPRFGVGTMYKLNDLVSLRGEVSHEYTTVGATFFF